MATPRAFGALVMITTVQPNKIGLIAWFGIIAALGVFVAIPIKRQLINREGLAFPTGTATAETLRTIHAAGSGQGTAAARALGVAALLAGALTFVRDYLVDQGSGRRAEVRPRSREVDVAIKPSSLVGAGALMSFRTGWSCFRRVTPALAPALFAHGLVKPIGGTVGAE